MLILVNDNPRGDITFVAPKGEQYDRKSEATWIDPDGNNLDGSSISPLRGNGFIGIF